MPQPDMLAYRFTSDDPFRIRGEVSLQTALDGCTGGMTGDTTLTDHLTVR